MPTAPAPAPLPFADYLAAHGYGEGLRVAYGCAVSAAVAAKTDPAVWLARAVRDARNAHGRPLRAAVRAYLRRELGLPADAVLSLLPRAPDPWEALTPAQLAEYYAALDGLPVGPAWCILQLLPRTGLRIGEICTLARVDVKSDSSWGLAFRLYDTDPDTGDATFLRRVVLSPGAVGVIRRYLASMKENATPAARRPAAKAWLFPGYNDQPLSPHAVRKTTRALRAAHPTLGDLSPRVLRHTFATYTLRDLVDVRALWPLLGGQA